MGFWRRKSFHLARDLRNRHESNCRDDLAARRADALGNLVNDESIGSKRTACRFVVHKFEFMQPLSLLGSNFIV